nr:MAG: replication initiator protein [Microvirus sp.]
MCLYPKLIQNPRYLPNKKNGYKPPKFKDERTLLVPIGCGYCIECRRQKSREWQVRLNEDIKHEKNKVMITLTFSDKALNDLTQEAELNNIYKSEVNEIATLAVRRFLERWRKKFKKSIKHWLVTELGHNGTERIHLHGILYTDRTDLIEKYWSYGYVYIGDYVNEKTINYIVKYITKLDSDHINYKPKILCSKGIGKNYIFSKNIEINYFNSKETKEYYQTRTGTKLNLPKYYRNYIYTDDEKELLWINKLDKEERWVCGEKVSIKESETDYFKLLYFHQQKNKRLGYGKCDNWIIELYKNSRKLLNKRKRD